MISQALRTWSQTITSYSLDLKHTLATPKSPKWTNLALPLSKVLRARSNPQELSYFSATRSQKTRTWSKSFQTKKKFHGISKYLDLTRKAANQNSERTPCIRLRVNQTTPIAIGKFWRELWSSREKAQGRAFCRRGRRIRGIIWSKAQLRLNSW